FLLDACHAYRLLPSFPTRRSSDLGKVLRVHAESMRIQRLQKAQEMAFKAGVKVLFPLLFFIFPGIFVVLLGPAALQLRGVLRQRSEEHTSELQSLAYLVCRLLLEK